jgi:8-oxo-dGTP diphosphatase
MELKQIIVATAIIFRDGKVLLQQRADSHSDFNGKWTTPCGCVEINENPRDTVVREVKEELGVDVEVISTIPHIDSFSNVKDKYHIIYLSYLCKIIAGEPENVDQEGETSAIGWFEIGELKELDLLRGTIEPIEIASKITYVS